MGTGCLLDLLGKPPCIHVSFGSELSRNGQHLLDRWIVELSDVPERTGTEFCERTPIKPDDVLLRGLLARSWRFSFLMVGHSVRRLPELLPDRTSAGGECANLEHDIDAECRPFPRLFRCRSG